MAYATGEAFRAMDFDSNKTGSPATRPAPLRIAPRTLTTAGNGPSGSAFDVHDKCTYRAWWNGFPPLLRLPQALRLPALQGEAGLPAGVMTLTAGTSPAPFEQIEARALEDHDR